MNVPSLALSVKKKKKTNSFSKSAMQLVGCCRSVTVRQTDQFRTCIACIVRLQQ